MTPPTTPLPESSHLERLSSGGNLLTSGWMNHTRPPLLTTRGHPLGIPSSGEDFKLMRNVLSKVGACQGLADARRIFWLIRGCCPCIYLDSGQITHCPQKATPPTTPLPERAPLALLSSGGTFEYRATPDKNIIRLNVYHNNSTKRSATALCRRLRHAEEIGWPRRNS